MSDFEPFDDELATAMRRRSPAIDASGLSTATAHDAVLARAHHIRRRRAGIAGGVSLIAITALGFVVFDGGADDTLVPASDPSTTLSIPPTVTPSTFPGATTTNGPTAPSTTAPTTTGPTTTGPTTTAPTTTAAPVTTTVPPTVTATVAPTAPPPAPTTETVPSSGGSITYRWDGTSLTLVSTDPAPDHTAEIEDQTSTRLRVRFDGPNESRVEVRVEDGVPVVRID
jgi:hypothetical protein